MNTPNDGGPAFPHAQRLWDNDAQSWAVHSVGGMTLRDWFAGQTINGIMANDSAETERCYFGLGQKDTINNMAAFAYAIADAMLAESAKGAK